VQTRPIATDGVAWSVGQSVTTANPAKTAESIDMPFGLCDSGGPEKALLDGVLHGVQIHMQGTILREKGAAYSKVLETLCRELYKMTETTEMPCGMWTPVGPRVHGSTYEIRVHTGATWRTRLNRPCAAAMRPFCQITLTTCYYSYYSINTEKCVIPSLTYLPIHNPLSYLYSVFLCLLASRSTSAANASSLTWR